MRQKIGFIGLGLIGGSIARAIRQYFPDYEIVAYCRSGEDAIARYGEVKPDLVTMDIIMQGMDGLDATELILKEHPDARIVIVSSLAYDDTFDRANTLGAKGFIDKPFHREQLLKVFEKALS